MVIIKAMIVNIYKEINTNEQQRIQNLDLTTVQLPNKNALTAATYQIPGNRSLYLS